jgi:hypothetical protein
MRFYGSNFFLTGTIGIYKKIQLNNLEMLTLD